MYCVSLTSEINRHFSIMVLRFCCRPINRIFIYHQLHIHAACCAFEVLKSPLPQSHLIRVVLQMGLSTDPSVSYRQYSLCFRLVWPVLVPTLHLFFLSSLITYLLLFQLKNVNSSYPALFPSSSLATNHLLLIVGLFHIFS